MYSANYANIFESSVQSNVVFECDCALFVCVVFHHVPPMSNVIACRMLSSCDHGGTTNVYINSCQDCFQNGNRMHVPHFTADL
jgi:hypothetical protein